MRLRGMALLLLLSGCSLPFGGSVPPSDPPRSQTTAYTGPLNTVVVQQRAISTTSGIVTLSSRLIRPEAIPGIPQRSDNDCGSAALATLLAYYRLKAAGGDPDPLTAVEHALPPQQWGTSIEDACNYLNRLQSVGATQYRAGSLDGILATAHSGRPVPVVVTFEASLTKMHWLLVIGDGMTPQGERYVLAKNPSDTDPLAVAAFTESVFLDAWANRPLRTQWWSGLLGGVAGMNPANYQQPWLDCGLVGQAGSVGGR